MQFHGSRHIFERIKHLHGSSFRLHGTRGAGQGFERHSVYVFNLISSFDRLRVRFHLYADSCTHLNRANVCTVCAVKA